MKNEHLNINGYIVKVDAQKTKALYESLPLVSEENHCGCVDCRYYAKAIMHTSPVIQHYFQQFGIDPRKEANVWKAGDFDDGTYLYIVDYRFIGEIVGTDQLDWIEIDEAKFSLSNHPALPSPTLLKTLIPPMIVLHVEIMIDSTMNKIMEK